ncbi:DNA-dependent protein kinase catalytic subunit [Vulpes lagopus]
MADGGSGVRGSLLQLRESLSAGDRCSAATASYQLIRGLGQDCVLSSDPAALVFRDCREEVLKFLYIFLEKIGEKITPYSLDIKTTCTSVYTKDKAAKCKIPALDLLIKLLRTLRSSRLMDEFSIGELFNKFYGELALKTKIQDTVLEKIYELLGVLAEVHPSEMINNSEKLFRAFLGELKIQMTSAIREPKLPVLAGCLKGLSSLMCNFTKSMEEDPQTSREIFDFALKAIRPQIDLKRYAVPLAGLCLFTLHASQFSTCLLDNYVSLFEVLSKWCSHTNVEMKKAAHSALESFLKQISFMVAKDAEMHKSKLQYFMEQFYGIIRNMDSNSKDLSIAIRGYGLFAGPCKVINAKDVDFMYIELIQRCKQLFLTQIDTVDDHVYHMPSFLQSIASVLLYLDRVPEVYTPVLEHLMVAQIDSFPQYSPKMQSVCCKALVKVFLALGGKGPVLWNCISTVVHQGLIRICSKPVILQKGVESEPEEYRASGEVRTGKWKVPTYKDYLDLFRSLLSCDQMMDSLLADEAFLFVNSSLQNLNRLLYDEFVKSVLKIIEKLDLTLEKWNVGEHEDENEATGVWVIPTSDPAANLHPAKPKDFSAFINLVEFCRDILPEKHIEFFEPWVYSFAYELILQSTRLPLISGFYKLLSVAVRNAKKIKYFEGVGVKSQTQAPKDPEKYSCFALFAKFGKEVSVKMKQYKDELLASCLTFILSLPHDIIELDIRAYIPALQMAFKLGLSYTPLAEVGLNALEEWSVCICKHIIQPHYKDILPSLDGYLKTSALSDETKNNWEVSALSQAAQKGFNQVVLKHLKKTKNISSNEALSLEEIRTRVVQMLGFLGGQINKNLLTATSSDEMMKKCVAACELLHSVVMFMLGKATQMPECGQGFPPMYQLYKRTFPVLLRLACDVDQVTRQLYEPLVMQLIHWFTNNKKFESHDTVALLETILDGIVDPVDSTLRDFCGRCIREFLKWSIKQTTPQQQEKSPVNTKSLFKRLYSFALHPNAFKRLGASLAFNNIYREFREEESLVEQFVFEALVTYLESLALAHTDEKPLGTIRQCCDAIDHLSRIIEKKHVSLNKVKKRRRPRGFPPSASLCLLDMVQWLLAHCGRPQTECRHKSIELFYKFVPLLPGNKSPSLWLKDFLKNKDTSFLINTFEGGGGGCDRLSGILAQPTLFHLQGPFSLRAALQWMDMLLAALECYNTFIEEKTLKAPDVLGTETQSSLWKAVAFFLENIAMHDITAAEKCFGTGAAGHRPSPQEGERYNYSKCTIVVRIMEFTTTLLNTSPEGWKLLEEDLCNNENFMTLLVKTLCQPSSIGFNIGDVLVMNHLPDVCVNLMKALRKSPYKDALEMCLKEKITVQSIEELCAVDLYGPDAYVDRATLASVVSACKQLHRAGVLHVVLPSQSADQRHSVGIKLLFLVYKNIAPGDEREYFPSLDPSCKRLANGLLELAFAFGGLCEHLVDLLLDTAVLSMPASGESQRNMVSFSHGEYFYSLFSEIINTELLRNLDMTVLKLMKSSVDNPKMVSAILNGMLDQSFRDRASQKQQGLKLASTILHNWKKWDSWWAKDSTPESKTAVLTLLAKILQIDSSVSFNTNHSAFPEVFTTYTSLLADSNLGLHLMGQAVILLPFFTNLTGGSLEDLEHVLEKLIVSNFPMKSEEFPLGTLRYSNYVDCMKKKFLDALELSQSPVLLQLMTEILCREQQHVMEELFQSTFKKIARKSSCVTQLALLERVYRMFKRDDLLSNVTRQAFVDRSLLTLLWHCGLSALREFFGKIVVETIDVLKSRFTKLNESTFDTQITKKMGFYKMLDVMYSRLSKDDVHSKESKINQVFHGSCVTEGNELTKTLIKLCYDAFTENMAGENQLLERRRLYHCAAYNCAISVICCVFTELKFYQGFLFSEKPEKNLLILENLIDLKRCYTFPIEVEVPMERKKKYIEIRREAREAANGDSDGPHYLSSLSHLADSSLSEEMSQFDFSTGVQSYSYGSQDPKSTHGHFRRREHKDPMVQDAVLELEMDELNQHECMATMTALIKHMQRNQILSKDEGSVPRNLPPWMKFLHDKLGNPSVSLNIRLFLAKLVINTEEVFRPYAKYWLSPLLQLVVSENNGGEGIHYMVVEIVVTVLSWTGLATPVGVPKDEVLANRLLHFLMEHVFHQKRAVFRHNLEIIKTLVECWKDCLSVPYRLIFEKFSSKDPNSKDNSVGIQLLGIVMANNLPPYDPKCGIESIKCIDNRTEILRLRRRFIKDQEKLSLIYARKGIAEQKREKEIKSELKMKHDAQVILYRSYRQGDLPDIQIKYSSLITPLQAVAQRDPIIAKQLFGSLFSGIIKEMDKYKTMSEKNNITQKLLQDFNHFLNSTFSFFPPFEISCQHTDLLSLDPGSIRASCLASLQQPVGVLLLEEALLHLGPQEPPAKQFRGRMRVSPDVVRWMELAKLYRSIGEYDILRGIFSSEIGTKQITQSAILAEARSDYSEAAKQYNEALNKEEWVDGEPTEAEKDFWELASLDCYNQLAEWKSLAYCSIVSVDNENPPDLNKMWSEPFYQETYLPYMIRSKLKLLLQGEADQSLLTFIDEAVNKELQKALIELHYSQELSLLYILQDDIDRAKYYIENCIQIFMQNYSSIDVLLHRSRLTKLQSVQTMIEIQEFISFISRQGNLSSQAPLKRLLKSWTNRYPDARMDPVHIWDDIITNRCFFLSKIEEKLTLPLGDHSLSMDEERDSSDKMEVQEQGEEVCSLIKNCMFSMKMKMVESARKQHNFSLAMKLLKELRRESKTRDDWQVKWVHTYCRLSHSRIQGQSCLQQILSALKTVSLLGESTSSYFSKNVLAFHDQNILLGTTYSIIANALRREPACLAEIEESRARRILDLSGSSLENAEKVIAVLYQRAFHHLSEAVRTAEEEAQPSLRGQGPVASLTDAYMTLADFCDQQLRKEEESASVTESVELQTYPGLVVDKMLKALKLHSSEARLKFPRLLQIIELYPEETLSLMTKEISSIPCWQFIGWISHMLALLDQEEAVAVQCTVEEIANNYPQAIVYPFIISSESYSFKDTSTGHKNKEFVARIKTKLDLGGVIQDFISALEQLSNPEMLFKDWTDDIKAELAKNPVNKKNIEKMYERMYAALGDLRAPGLGAFRRRFIQVFGKEFDKHFGKGGSKLPGMKLRDFGSITDSLFYKMCKDSKPPGNLKECSPWMSDFKVEFLRNELEIPGQYDGKGKPLPEYHARIAGFDERVGANVCDYCQYMTSFEIKVMASIRKPKRIIIRGHDEKEYPFLVKGGEDLRQDQRIEQLFEVMNVLLSQDTACSQRNMQLKTYHVIPMTSRLGLIEWIENTLTLKDFLLSNMSREEKAAYTSDPKAPPCEYRDWLAKMSGKYDVGAYMSMFKAASRTETVTSFRRRESKVPADLLKRAFLKMSTGPAAFLALRSHFASSHALMCISHWILGIGDRHLNNFMVSMETGGLIGIDFGHAFGSATQFLPVPELMPFRLTRQFINLMLPMKEAGVVYSIMVHALRAFRSHSDLLTNTMDVFVKEPSFDWKNFEQKMLKKGGSWIQEINITEKNWYPRQKIHYAKRKLAGANPAVITCDELFLGHEKALAFEDYVAVARGSKDHNIRAQQPENGLSEEAQVKCLIDQATDPNILGRTWIGWEPWM